MKPQKTMKQAYQENLAARLDQEKQQLDQTVLGKVQASYLDYESYNLDCHYIMSQKVKNYRHERKVPYSQFISGMIPDKVLRNIIGLDSGQKPKVAEQYDIGDKQKPLMQQQTQQQSKENGNAKIQTGQGQVKQCAFFDNKATRNGISNIQQQDSDKAIRETSLQRQNRKWKELNNNALGFLLDNKQSSQSAEATKLGM